MTEDELLRNWRNYAVEFWEDGSELLLRNVFSICWRTADGLLFDNGKGEGGGRATFLKCDENGFCYNKIAKDGKWRLVGKFIRVED